PFQADERRCGPLDLELAHQRSAADALGTQSQIVRDDCVIVWLELGLGDRRAFTDRASFNRGEPVATRSPSAGAKALAHIFSHPCKALALAREGMPLIDPHHDAIPMNGSTVNDLAGRLMVAPCVSDASPFLRPASG